MCIRDSAKSHAKPDAGIGDAAGRGILRKFFHDVKMCIRDRRDPVQSILIERLQLFSVVCTDTGFVVL